MGGYGSGRTGGRPTVDASRALDLGWLLRQGGALKDGYQSGTIEWSCNGAPTGSINYRLDMQQVGGERLILNYSRGSDDGREDVEQIIRLTYSVPHYGGKRWWMICPYGGGRVGKLFLPAGGDRFASRKAWRLSYQSQRNSPKDRAFEALFKIQRRLGCERGWDNYPTRPKGMHHTTYKRLMAEFDYLDGLCSMHMMQTIGLLQARIG